MAGKRLRNFDKFVPFDAEIPQLQADLPKAMAGKHLRNFDKFVPFDAEIPLAGDRIGL
ncbi:MAG: hypothetical protein ABWK53_03490 [Anaerolineales bacterium]